MNLLPTSQISAVSHLGIEIPGHKSFQNLPQYYICELDRLPILDALLHIQMF